METKLCLFCENFDWEKYGYIHYSTMTGGDETGGATCHAGHFFEERPDDLEKFLLQAETCKDYLLAK